MNQHSFTHWVSFVYLWQSTSCNLSCKVSFLYTSWVAEMNTVAIKFCFKTGLSATETLVLVQNAYGNKAVNRSNVFKGYSRFRGGRDLVEDDEWGGRPKSNPTKVNISAVADLVKNDRWIASPLIAESFNTPKTVFLPILREVLRKRKLCARFVTHF
jgi:hypothetical protein